MIELTREQELTLEKNLVLVFTLPQTEIISKLIFSNLNVLADSMLGEHLGIVTDRRVEGFSTNRDFNGERRDYFFSNEFEGVWRLGLRKLILQRVYAQFNQIDKMTVFLEHPGSNFAADIIASSLPESKVVIITNDGRRYVERQVISLMNNKEVKDGLKSFSSKEKIPFIEQQSKRWKKMINVLLSLENFCKKQNLLIISIDEIISNPKNSLEKIFKFLNSSLREEEIVRISKNIENEKLKTNLKNFVANWRKSFSEKEKEIMNSILEPELKKLNFE